MNKGAKLLIIMVLIAISIGGGLSYANSKRESIKKVEVVQPVTPPRILSVADIDTDQLYKLVNGDRAAAGIRPLLRDPLLDSSSQDKCNDMAVKKYWSHDSPDGTKPWQFIGKYTTYFKAGENLEYGYQDAASVVTAWMKSPGHRKNILDSEFTHAGYAVCLADSYQGLNKQLIVVQHFIRP